MGYIIPGGWPTVLIINFNNHNYAQTHNGTLLF